MAPRRHWPARARARAAAQRTAIAVGCAAIAFGLWQLVVATPSSTRPIAAVGWLAGVLVAHDAVLAPLAVVAGLVLVRAVPAAARRVVGVGLFVAVCVTAVALPALLTPGVAGNPSATPRDYGRGLLVTLALDVVLTLIGSMVAVRRSTT